MMKLGEAANRLSRLGVLAPDGVDWALAIANRNFIIHQYDKINRELTWLTLSRDLPAWRSSLKSLFAGAATTIEEEAGWRNDRPPDLVALASGPAIVGRGSRNSRRSSSRLPEPADSLGHWRRYDAPTGQAASGTRMPADGSSWQGGLDRVRPLRLASCPGSQRDGVRAA